MKIIVSYLSLNLFFTCVFAQSQTIFLPSGIQEKQLKQIISEKKAEHKLEFAFDIHSVLVHKEPAQQWKTILKYPRKIEFVKVLWNLPLMINLGSIVWQFIINILPWHKKKYHEVTSERFICNLLQANAHDLAALFMIIINQQRPDSSMIELVKELKQNGYAIRIASNIGKRIYKKLKEKLEQIGQNIFAHFDQDAQGMEGKTVDYAISPAEKPDPQYYKEYLDTYDPDRSKLIIFVDDKLVNICSAIKQGFLGIHFKNARQFRKDLMSLGIL